MGRGSRIEIETGAILAAAAALLMLPLSFLLSFLMAVLVHEACHYLVLRLLDVEVYRITVGPFGASMETETMEPGREVLCALAGPLGSFLLVVGYRIIPEIAICGLVQGCFNLLPVLPMDGGRILAGMLELLKVPEVNGIMLAVRWMTGIIIGGLCIYGFLMWNLGYGVLILGFVVVWRTLPRKTPCKEGSFGVQ